MTQGQYRSRVSFGRRQEYIAIAKLLQHGFDVYMPLVDDQQIDCVIRRDDHDYLDVQIKAKSRDCKLEHAGLFSAMVIPCPREKYFFLFYSEHINTYWVFPSQQLVEVASQNRSGKNKGKYSINLTGFRSGVARASERFCQYQDNFDLLWT